MQVIVFDPTREISRRAETMFTAAGPEIVSVGSLRPLAALLAAGTPDDILIARVARTDDGLPIAECLLNSRFFGTTFLVVDHPDQLGLEQRLRLPRTESIHFSPALVDGLLRRVAAGAASAPPPARMPARRERATFHGLVGRSKQILDVFARIEKAAAGDANVCIYGESGTGKELIARAIHAISDRRNGPLITFDCAAVPEGLAESQLFGHVRGAFTGAIENREGVFSQADNGTLFIDELCELSPNLQAKLLRVIQSREFVKVGGTKPIRTDIRLVTATNKDPKKAADAGTFRADLYYRVAVVVIRVPPLRERREDIPSLVAHFMDTLTKREGVPPKSMAPEAVQRLRELEWPGNVRELRNTIERLLILSSGPKIGEDDIARLVGRRDPDQVGLGSLLDCKTFEEFKQAAERAFLLGKLREHDWNVSETARALDMPRSNLYKKIERYALTRETAS